jgi:hypothetical protein
VNSPNGPSEVRSLGKDLRLDHQLRVRRHQHVRGPAAHQLQRLPQQRAHHRAFVLVDRAEREGAQRDRGVDADGERDRQRLVARLGDPVELPQVLAGRQVDRGGVTALDHQAVVGAVPGVGDGVFRERDRRRQVRAGVTRVMDDLGQRAEVQRRPSSTTSWAGPFATTRGGSLSSIARRYVGSVASGAQPIAAASRERLACRLVRHGERAALHLLEQQHRAPLALALELHDQRGDLVGGIDFARDYDVVVGLLLFDLLQEAAKVLGHSRRW